jgi:hypothetical protein
VARFGSGGESIVAQQIIDKDSFINRLTALCVRSGLHGLPRKRSDRAILLKSIVQRLVPGRAYTEVEINESIQEWLRAVAPALETDHVSLRRSLVDDRFLEREAGGVTYRLGCRPPGAIGFAAEVEGLDIQDVVEGARRVIAARRREYSQQHGDESAD